MPESQAPTAPQPSPQTAEPSKAQLWLIALAFAIVAGSISIYFAIGGAHQQIADGNVPHVITSTAEPPPAHDDFADRNGTIQANCHLQIFGDKGIVDGPVLTPGTRANCIGVSKEGIKIKLTSGSNNGSEGWVQPDDFHPDPLITN